MNSKLITAFSLNVILVFQLEAAVVHVPDDYATIQAALDNSQDYDTVFVSNGLYVENLSWPDKQGIKLIGEDRNNTQIDGNASGRVIEMLYQPYYVSEPWDTNTVVKDLTIMNGSYYSGAGIEIGNSGPLLEGLIVTNNSCVTEQGSEGAGISCFYAHPILREIQVTNNVRPEIQDGGFNVGGGAGVSCDNSNVMIRGLTISGNVSYGDCLGVGLYIFFSTVDISNSTISDNVGITSNNYIAMGGGIFCHSSDLILNNVLIHNNSAGMQGGVDFGSSSGQFTAVEISENEASDLVGGLAIWNSQLVCDDVHILNNSTPEDIAGINLSSESSLVANDLEIVGNSAGSSVGGMLISFSFNTDSLRLSGMVIRENSAFMGGGINISSGGGSGDDPYIELENIQITDNTAGFTGGGILFPYGYNNNFIKNCTISNNTSGLSGGGIFLTGFSGSGWDISGVEVTNSIVRNNWPDNIGVTEHIYSQPYDIEVTYSDWTNTLDDFDAVINLIEENNLDLNPLFEVTDGIYNLSEDSPCIDAGDPDSPHDPDGTLADMGAFYYPQEYMLGDLNQDFIVDILDIIVLVDIILGTEPTPLQTITGDLDNSGEITVLDLILMINIILS